VCLPTSESVCVCVCVCPPPICLSVCAQEVLYQEETVTASKVLESVEVVEVQISQVDNMFRCHKCERSFKLYYHLKQHLKTHAGPLERVHVCAYCGKAYRREGALKQHVATFHFEAEELSRSQRPQKRVHVCEYCDKNFDHFGHFKEHLRKHTGQAPACVRACARVCVWRSEDVKIIQFKMRGQKKEEVNLTTRY